MQMGVFLTEDALQALIERVAEQATAKVLQALKTQSQPKERYTYKEFCEAFSVCESTIRNWGRNKNIRIEALGNRRYVHIVNQQGLSYKINGRIA